MKEFLQKVMNKSRVKTFSQNDKKLWMKNYLGKKTEIGLTLFFCFQNGDFPNISHPNNDYVW